MRTAIFTTQETTLNITVDAREAEQLSLVQMGRENATIRLNRGNNSVPVGPGVFKVLSEFTVHIAGTGADLWVASTIKDKDGNWPDPRRLQAIDGDALLKFFEAKGESLK